MLWRSSMEDWTSARNVLTIRYLLYCVELRCCAEQSMGRRKQFTIGRVVLTNRIPD